ncbi:molybdopterin-dependent oxidoreductase [bacterium]|nr:molybdopterin-dependent oxidoreductase [candidate division CSSED10-310 bacterium]
MNTGDVRDFAVVGKSARKVDGLSMATGRAMYVDDIRMDGMLYGRILSSPHAHAVLESIDTSRAEAIPGVRLVLTCFNTKRIMHTTAGQGFPEPSPYDTALFNRKMRYVGDRVAAVAAESEAIAEEALAAIRVEYRTLPALFDAEKAFAEGAPIIHDEPDAYVPIPVTYEPERNLAASVEAVLGDVEKGLAGSDLVFEHTYQSHYASHCMLEPPVVIAYMDENDRLVIRTSTQVPFHVRRIVAQALDFPVRRIRVVKPRIGGGFGGKQEVMLEPLAALMTIETGRPVRMIMSRREVFVSARTRHPMRISLRTGITRSGDLQAIDMDCLMNTGAYGSHALTVASNAGSKTLPMFNKVPNISFRARTAYTNLPVGGAYRGYGATQAAFAFGQQIDIMARAIGMDIQDFYRRNIIHPGETSPIFQKLGEGREGVEMTVDSCGLDECMKLGAAAFDWSGRKGRRTASDGRALGAGMVCLMQGSSIPEIDMGGASIKINDDGSFNLLVGATDLGTGSDTVLAQMAAEILGTTVDHIIVYSSDTDLTPFDVGAYASSTTYLSGMAVIKAAQDAHRQVCAVAAEMLEVDPLEITLAGGIARAASGGQVSLEEVARYSLYQRNQFQIIGTASHISHKSPPPFAAHFVQVAVEEDTGKVQVLDYVAAVDCGTAINPILAEGQVEGAVVNGMSFALTEEYLFNAEGRMMNADWNDYKIYNAVDTPPVRTILVPTYEPTGPFGAKSVSEININGALPAIANAIFDAVGVRLYASPFTPERVLNGIKALRAEK